VIRLTGERAEKKQMHWQAVAASASEQCGRNRVPVIDLPERLDAWLARQAAQADVVHAVLSLHPSTQPLSALREQASAETKAWVLLNGPEGGLTDAEDVAARAKGFLALGLGERVLRAETAALGALTLLTLS
jgi:16S rRNA (uracil1498-N3)-methyltransferase